MSDTAARWRTLAAGFGARVEAVGPGQWDRPAPCDGWVARDVVEHLTGWVPGVLALDPVRAADPVAAWQELDRRVQAALDDPAGAAREVVVRGQSMPFEQAVATFCLADVLVHTWDLARATGQDDTLDPGEVHRAVEGFRQVDEQLLVDSGHYGPRPPLPPGADEQTELLTLTGRDPSGRT